MSPLTAHRQSGAALAISLIVLTILTLLGIAAMRSSRLELRLSQNAESRISAMENAQSTADAITSVPTSLNVAAGPGYVNCYVNANSTYAPASPTFVTPCVTSTLALPDSDPTQSGDTDPIRQFRYVQVKREAPEFVTAAALRGSGTSGRSYDYARFTVTAGFDNSLNGMGAAEVAEGVLSVHVKPTGVVYQ